jgi:Cof subfamily protein (haloacid dehalogenase superfamily)
MSERTKIIVYDLDQTLLRTDKTVGEYTYQILDKLRAMGHITVTNTARSEIFTKELEPVLPPCDYFIYNGGALIKDAEGRTVYRSEIPNEKVLPILDDFMKLTEDFSVQTDEALFTSRDRFGRDEARYFDFCNERFPYSALKMLAAIDDDADAKEIAARHGVEMITYVGGRWRRFNTLGTSKLSGTKNLCAALGIPLADCIFFGDDFGDLESIDAVGVGVLMKNADEAHKTDCRTVTEYTNDEDGVARFLAEYFSL